jgi:hypothetical protein
MPDLNELNLDEWQAESGAPPRSARMDVATALQEVSPSLPNDAGRGNRAAYQFFGRHYQAGQRRASHKALFGESPSGTLAH